MRARGLGGTEIPIHVEDDDITNERRRSGRDIAHLKLFETERPWFDTAHFSHLSPFLVSFTTRTINMAFTRGGPYSSRGRHRVTRARSSTRRSPAGLLLASPG